MGAGLFPWSSPIKSSKNKHFSQQTLDRLKVANSSVKTTYLEIVKTNLQENTGLSVKPVEYNEYHKCNPCEAAFCRYPLNLKGSIKAIFGGPLYCEPKCSKSSTVSAEKTAETSSESSNELISHPYQPLNKCFANSRVLIAHYADYTLINSHMKLVLHCVIDYCLPRYMYSPALGTHSLGACKVHLINYTASVRERVTRATLGLAEHPIVHL